nr:hypothetical protein [Mesorhizobium tianshanense]
MRRFVLHGPDGELVALLDFDPLFSGGKVIGYATSFKRKHVNATAHAEIGLTKFAVDRFREQGISVVTPGLSPLVDIGPSGFAEATSGAPPSSAPMVRHGSIAANSTCRDRLPSNAASTASRSRPMSLSARGPSSRC